jgi:hypothetical protein
MLLASLTVSEGRESISDGLRRRHDERRARATRAGESVGDEGSRWPATRRTLALRVPALVTRALVPVSGACFAGSRSP